MLVAVLISVGGEMLSSHWLALDHVTSASSYDGPGDGGAVKPTRKAAVLPSFLAPFLGAGRSFP